nr:hypothetical protein [Pandoravirus massiliensis]
MLQGPVSLVHAMCLHNAATRLPHIFVDLVFFASSARAGVALHDRAPLRITPPVHREHKNVGFSSPRSAVSLATKHIFLSRRQRIWQCFLTKEQGFHLHGGVAHGDHASRHPGAQLCEYDRGNTPLMCYSVRTVSVNHWRLLPPCAMFLT